MWPKNAELSFKDLWPKDLLPQFALRFWTPSFRKCRSSSLKNEPLSQKMDLKKSRRLSFASKLSMDKLALDQQTLTSFFETATCMATSEFDYVQSMLGTIDYRCADGRFLMSPRGMEVSNTRYLSSSETRVNAGIRA
jgi:hypothetical protein